jgi:branched-chain amino acid transport system ATP-binding protein
VRSSLQPPLLEVTNVAVQYGRIPAVRDVSLKVGHQQIVALIGPNGAGKSTTLRAIAGLLKPSAGVIRLGGEDVTGLPAEKMVRKGLALCPEGRKIFSKLTVLENLLMGAYAHRGRKDEPTLLEDVFTLFPRLRERRTQLGGTLSGGEQQMLAIGRALMARPTCLLLDEPSMGLAPLVLQDIASKIVEVNRRGVSFLIVEQNAHAALDLAHDVYVLETGQVVAHGTSGELMSQDTIRRAYLGLA